VGSTLRPWTPGRMFSLGIWTSSMRTMPVVLARSDSLPLMGGQSRPFIPFHKPNYWTGGTFSRIKPRILPSHLHFAHTTQISAMGELVIQVLAPEIEYPDPFGSSVAVVSILPGSEPWFAISSAHTLSGTYVPSDQNSLLCCPLLHKELEQST
jgi:hypothetical protein